MKLNSIDAYKLLMKAKRMNDDGYIKHSINVAEAAFRIAKHLNLDSDKAKALGFIHDIGKQYGEPYSQHVARGYEYLRDLNIDDEYANICLTHSYLNNDINCTAGILETEDIYKYNFKKDFIKNYEYSIYDKIICFCDLICSNQFMILEERLIDVMIKRGIYSNTQYHIIESFKLKKELEKIMKINIYLLFPEIIKRISK